MRNGKKADIDGHDKSTARNCRGDTSISTFTTFFIKQKNKTLLPKAESIKKKNKKAKQKTLIHQRKVTQQTDIYF